MNYAELTLTEITKLPGVSDLRPTMCKARFAQALKAEAKGEYAEAERLLGEAVAAEGSQ